MANDLGVNRLQAEITRNKNRERNIATHLIISSTFLVYKIDYLEISAYIFNFLATFISIIAVIIENVNTFYRERKMKQNVIFLLWALT